MIWILGEIVRICIRDDTMGVGGGGGGGSSLDSEPVLLLKQNVTVLLQVLNLKPLEK